MKILHVIPSYVPAYRYGGPLRAVFGLAEAQVQAGDEVTVFTTDADGPERLNVESERAVKVGSHSAYYFRVSFPRRLHRAPRMVASLRRQLPGFDLVHLHSVFLWPTLAAAREARRARRPYVVSPRGMLVNELIAGRGSFRKRAWLALFEKRTLARCSRIVVTSELERVEICRLGLDLAPIREVPNGIDPEVLRRPDPSEVSEAVSTAIRSGPYLLFLGRISWKKGLERLVRVASRGTLRLILAGPDDEGLESRLRALASELQAGSRVEFLGEVRGVDRAALLHEARALVLPSSSENFGNSALEAMACGAPVILTPGVGLAGLVERAQAGWVVAGDEALLSVLQLVSARPDLAAAAGERGREVVRESFDWESIARRMADVYREAMPA